MTTVIALLFKVTPASVKVAGAIRFDDDAALEAVLGPEFFAAANGDVNAFLRIYTDAAYSEWAVAKSVEPLMRFSFGERSRTVTRQQLVDAFRFAFRTVPVKDIRELAHV